MSGANLFTNVAAFLLLVGTFYFAHHCTEAVRSGVVRFEFGYEFPRAHVPSMYWILVLANGFAASMLFLSAYGILTGALT